MANFLTLVFNLFRFFPPSLCMHVFLFSYAIFPITLFFQHLSLSLSLSLYIYIYIYIYIYVCYLSLFFILLCSLPLYQSLHLLSSVTPTQSNAFYLSIPSIVSVQFLIVTCHYLSLCSCLLSRL